jgi:glutamyl-tRNA reductase
MTIAVTGLSYRNSPVELREKFTLDAEELPRALDTLKACFPSGGVVLLNTCNRAEVYVHASESASEVFDIVRNFLSEWHRLPEQDFRNHLYERSGRDAVSHAFRVASSLDSMVVGEQQILGQVHDAFLAAQQAGTVDKITNALFQRAFRVAKEVRSRTAISEGKVSVASVAVDVAVSIFNDLRDKTVLLVGSGETAELALKALISRGAGHVIIANRTVQNAAELAQNYRGEAISLDQLSQHLHRADIIISSTGAKEPVLREADFHHALRHRNQEPMLAVDIAVPRDIEAAVDRMNNVYLYTIDDLQQAAEENLNQRRQAALEAERIVEREVEAFTGWQRRLFAEPTLVSMSQELHAIRERELEKTLAQLQDLTDAQREEIEYLTKRIVNKILQRPMSQIKEEAAHEDPHGFLYVVKRLFGIEDPA